MGTAGNNDTSSRNPKLSPEATDLAADEAELISELDRSFESIEERYARAKADGRAAVVEDEEELDKQFEWLESRADEIFDFALRIGVPDSLFLNAEELSKRYGLDLHGIYFYDGSEMPLLVNWRSASERDNSCVRYGAKWILCWSEIFSDDWYLAQIFLALLNCIDAKGDEQLRLALYAGKLLSEAHWRNRTSDSLFRSVSDEQRRLKAGLGGGSASARQKEVRLDAYMCQIEELADIVGKVSEAVGSGPIDLVG
ncbi:hypothetical protein PVW46_13430, partial [Mameliella sp. AT18]|uniref:hypothetical protein n=1 Tax=Mameliella sp. AT18 TaxID=3028385 RepID=UPI00237BC4F0